MDDPMSPKRYTAASLFQRMVDFCIAAGGMKDPDEVVQEMTRLLAPDMGILVVYRLPRRLAKTPETTPVIGETLFFGDSSEKVQKYRAEWERDRRISLIAEFARGGSAPITISEVRRRISLPADERYILERLDRCDIVDAVYCPTRRWLVVIWSNETLAQVSETRITPPERFMLCALAQVAVARIEDIQREERLKRDDKTFSDLEIEILILRSQGMLPKDIGKEIKMNPKTVRTHLYNVMQKLGCHEIGAALCMAVRLKVIP